MLKPLESDITLRLFHTSRRTAQVPTSDGTMVNITLPVTDVQYLKKNWYISYKGESLMLGFVKGINGDKVLFHNPHFKGGVLKLSAENTSHQLIYQWLQLYPGFKEAVLPFKETPAYFYQDNPDETAQKELEFYKQVDRANALYNRLQKKAIEALAEYLNIQGSYPVMQAAIKKLCNQNPTLILKWEDSVEDLEKREILSSAFKLKILEINHDNRAVLWSEGKGKILDFDPNYADENQQTAFCDNIIFARDRNAKTVYEQIARAVNVHIDGLASGKVKKNAKATEESIAGIL